jgi:hypothetical protein
MLIVPLQPVPNQTLQTQLSGQACTFNVVQLAYGVFVDVYVGATLIIAGVIGLNLTLIVRSAYLGFLGDIVFFDTQGTTDPIYTGFGSRYQLVYLTESDIAAFDLPTGIE